MTAEQQKFLDMAVPLAQREAKRAGILASVTIAQAIIESDWGRSVLATRGHNYFGIKGDYLGNSIDKTTGEFVNGQAIRIVAKFRSYPNSDIGFQDHSNFLRRSHYSKVWYETDYKKACYELKKAGYATSPTYVKTLTDTIERLNLTQYDVPLGVPTVEVLSINKGVVQGDNIEGIPFSSRIIVKRGRLNVRTERKLEKLVGITIHDTANTKAGADAEMHATWLQNVENNDAQDISIHFFVDSNSITQCIPVDEVSFNAGTHRGNYQTISIEICENKDGNRAQAEKNAQVLAAALLKTYPGIAVFKHQDHSGKYCPRVILGRNGWTAFKVGIYDLLDTTAVVEAPAALHKVTVDRLNVRNGPSVLDRINCVVSKGSIYTIVEVKNGWGRLKSGAGWISLKHTTKL